MEQTTPTTTTVVSKSSTVPSVDAVVSTPQPVTKSSHTAWLWIVLGLLLLLVSGAAGYYAAETGIADRFVGGTREPKSDWKPAPVVNDVVPEPEGGMTYCPSDARICPDGSTVGRSGPDCEFSACPGELFDEIDGASLDTEVGGTASNGAMPEDVLLE